MKDPGKRREQLFAEPEEGDSIGDPTELLRIVEELRESEQMFRRMIDASNDAIIVADENEIVHIWNPAAERLFGYRQEEVKKYHENLERMVEERTAALQKEMAAHKRLSAIVENSDDAIIGKTLDGIIVSWNKGAERIYQYTEEDAVGRSISFLVPDDRIVEIRKIHERLRKGERVDHFETFRKRKDGTLIDVSLTVSPIMDDEGNVIGASTIARDITQRKNAEKALKERERELFTLLGNLPGFAYRCLNDESWTMKFISHGCFHLTGYHPSELVDNTKLSYKDLIHPDDQLPVWKTVQEAVVEREPFRVSHRIRRAAGEEKWVWAQGVGVYTENGNLKWLEGYVVDITEVKRAEEELERLNEELEKRVHIRTAELRQALITVKQTQDYLVESQKMAALGEIVAGVAHEINTPVGVAVTASSYLEMKTKEIDRLLSTGDMKKAHLTQYLKRVLEISDTLLNNLSRASDLVKSFKQVAVDQSHETRRKFNLNDYSVVLCNLHQNTVSPPLLTKVSEIKISSADEIFCLCKNPRLKAELISQSMCRSLNQSWPEWLKFWNNTKRWDFHEKRSYHLNRKLFAGENCT